MKKRRFIYICVCLSMLLFSGCAGQIPDMTDEEREAISEYAAELLLEYDTSKPSRLVNLEELEEPEATPEPENTPEPEVTPEPESTPAPEVTQQPETTSMPELTPIPEMVWDSVEEALLLPEGVTLTFLNYDTVDAYQEETAGQQMLEAKAGNTLMIFHFSMTNNSDDVKSIDMLQDNILYKVYVGEEWSSGMITMLEQDLTTYMENLSSGESVELMLFAEVEKEALQGESTISIEFVCGEKRAQIVAR